MLAALGLAIRRPSPPSPPFAPDRSLSPPFAARAVLHAFIQSRASGHGLCALSPLMGIASVTSQITDHRGMLAALGLAVRRPSPPSPPFAPDRSLSPPFAARAVLHAFIQSRASGHGLCAPSPLMGIASVTSQITDHRATVTLAGTLPHGTFVAASGRRTAARQTGMALARRSLPGMPSAARFSSLWTAGRVSGFGPSTLMCPIPVKHTHTHTHRRRRPRR